MKASIWITFDLGIQGDYENLYEFLDSHGAKECTEDTAFLRFEYKKDLLTELKKELERRVTINKRSRVYLIYPKTASGSHTGTFLFGHRKQPRWTGYSANVTDEEDVGV